MAAVDIVTGRIEGAKQGTHAYYHEVGHIEFSKKPYSLTLRFFREHIPVIATLFLSIQAIVWRYDNWKWYTTFVSFIMMMLWVVIYEYEEQWCNFYARKRLREDKLSHGYDNRQS